MSEFWHYKSSRGWKGPFTTDMMKRWYEQRRFPLIRGSIDDLKVKRVVETGETAVIQTIDSMGSDPFSVSKERVVRVAPSEDRKNRTKNATREDHGKHLLFRALQSEPVSESKKDTSVVPPPTIPPPPHPPAQKPIVSSNKGRRRSTFGPFVLKGNSSTPEVAPSQPPQRFRRPSLMQSPEQKKKGLRGQHGFVHSASGSHIIQRFGGL